MQLTEYFGNIVNSKADVLVNAWNTNIIPWFLLWPHGVSKAFKEAAGYQPFNELLFRPMRPGSAILTSPGRLENKGIIHVAGINYAWIATDRTVRSCVRSAMRIVDDKNFKSIAFPLIGAGVGGKKPERVLSLMRDELQAISLPVSVEIVKYNPSLS